MKLSLCVCSIACLYMVALSSGATLPKFSAAPRLTYLGEYGNKKFYNNDVLLSWESGKNLCRANGMEALSFESYLEIEYLSSIFTDSMDFHWTSGQAQFGPIAEQHYWTNDLDSLNYVRADWGAIWSRFTSVVPFPCLAFKKDFAGGLDGHFESAPCSDLKPVICQQRT